MLVIRLQRTGRRGHAQFRVIVQDSRRTPTSGKIVAALGHFNPHTKETVLDKEKVSFYLEHGAQPSERVVRLLQAEGVKLPAWVQSATKKEGQIRNPEKLRRNRPADAEAEKPAEEAAPEESEASEASPEADATKGAEATESPQAASKPVEPGVEEEPAA